MADETLVQQAYTATLQHLIETGRAAHFTELAATLGVSPEEAKEAQHKAAEIAIGCWMSHDTDYVGSWAPFSNIPTQYLITIDGKQKWYGQWGLESLAVRWLFPGQEVQIDARCLDCGEVMTIRMKDEEILEVSPSTIVGLMSHPLSKWREISSAFNWSGMNIFRSEEHAKNWSLYRPESEDAIMSLNDWATAFSGSLFRNRLQDDYLSNMRTYVGEFIGTLMKMSNNSAFWKPE